MKEKPWYKHYDSGVPSTLTYPQYPVTYFLEETARRFPQNTCTIFMDKMINYQQMDRLKDGLAAALVEMGVCKGDRVAIFMPNIPQFILSFFAILKAGGVVVAINPTYKENEAVFQLNDSGAVLMLAISDAKPLLEKVQPQTDVRRIIYTDIQDAFEFPELANKAIGELKNNEKPSTLTERTDTLLGLLARFGSAESPDVTVLPDDAAIFQYSGGTTGIPKAAIGLHRNLVANIIQFRNHLWILEEGKQTFIDFIPLFHVYGMVIAMGVAIHMASRLLLLPNPRDIQNILKNIEKYEGSMLPGVPNVYHGIGHHPDVVSGKYDIHSIKASISGSAPLLRETKEQFERVTGGKLVEGYGLSEAPTATHCNPIMGENRTGSIGLPLPDVDARIVSLEDGKTEMAPGEPGELIIKGPQIMQGYHNMPEESKQALQDGWLFTGDIAYMDEDGYFFLVDRKKDVIKPGGLQVWPREVEEIIAAHPAVNEVGVAGVVHPQYGETVKAWVVLKAGQDATAEDIQSWCMDQIAQYKVPRHVEFIEQLPRTTVGKLLRRELIRWHNENSVLTE
ncbi:MAG: long-chain fatty acid--CoA ligase [Anaerolineaceae bacterium]|nr:long-chain fatty acid--CoA ligase [Anaerolineaceae bacterium]